MSICIVHSVTNNEFVAAGYFLTRRVTRSVGMAPELLPDEFLTLSTCLSDPAFEYWWNREGAESSARFGVPAERIEDLIAWYRARFDADLGAPNLAFSRNVISEFKKEFVADAAGLGVLGAGVATANAERILTDYPTPDNMGEYGVHHMLNRNMPLESGGMTMGFEIVSYEYGLEHSWLCNGLERDAKVTLGITPNPDTGLVDSHDEAQEVADYVNRPDVGAEPGFWFPALVMHYSD